MTEEEEKKKVLVEHILHQLCLDCVIVNKEEEVTKAAERLIALLK